MIAFDRFFRALAFLTILPVSEKPGLAADARLFAFTDAFPLVGIFIGLLSGSIYWLASSIWGGLLPALLAVAASLILTGALHEDGLADTADGFGGGWTKEQRLTIMKDSRLGTYGVLALGFATALKICALAMLTPNTTFFALIAVHAGARFVPVFIFATQDYAGDPATAKTAYASQRLGWPEVRSAFLWAALAIVPILLMQPLSAVVGIGLGGAMAAALMLYSKKAIGGYCGDVLGAMEQLFEIGGLLGFAAFSAGAAA